MRAVLGLGYLLGINGQRRELFDLLFDATKDNPFFTGYSGESDAAYRTLWFGQYDDLSGSIPMVEQSIDNVVTEDALKATYANRVNFITHSTGGLVARYYTILHQERVRKIIMVASPNQGVSLAYLNTDCDPLVFYCPSRGEIDQVLQTVAGWLLPRYPALYDGSSGGNPCKPAPDLNPPLNPPIFPDELVSDVTYINIYAETSVLTGDTPGDTPWDLLATLNDQGDWYDDVDKRPLDQAEQCGFDPTVDTPPVWCEATPTSWSELRLGDGTVAIGNACLPGVQNVKVQASKVHKDLLSDFAVQLEILIALDLPFPVQ